MDYDKLIEQLRWWADHCDRTNHGCHARPFLVDAATGIETLRAADVAPVRNGHWTDVGSLSCRCSECGCKNNRETAYCPACGARMNKEEGHADF